MLLDKQWQPTYLHASVSPDTPYTPDLLIYSAATTLLMSYWLKATVHPIHSAANTLMLLQSTFALCANLQRSNRQGDASTMNFCVLCVGIEVEQTVCTCYNNTFCMVYVSLEVEQTVLCLCNDILLDVCVGAELFSISKHPFQFHKKSSCSGSINSETPGDSKNVVSCLGDFQVEGTV